MAMKLTMAMTVSPADNGDEVGRASAMADDSDDAELLREILAEDRARDDAVDDLRVSPTKNLAIANVYRQLAEAEAMAALAAMHLNTSGLFKIPRALNMKLKKKVATPARKGVNNFTKKPCVFKAKNVSVTPRVTPTKKFREMVN